MRKTSFVALLAVPLSVVLTVPAASAAGPGKTCKTESVPAGPSGELAPLVGEGGYFYKQGGCASTVAKGAFDNPANVSALTTRAGYVQTCQLIREVEGFPFDFGYPFGPADQEVSSIPECAAVLKAIHLTPLPPMG